VTVLRRFIMASNLYIIFLIAGLSYTIIRNIYLFNKGLYNPYSFRKGERELPLILVIVITLGISIGGYMFMNNAKIAFISLIIFICYSLCLAVCTSILNFLSYKKIKDKNIVLQTIILDITIIITSISIWRYVGK
jgi:hypothetical protein